MKKLCLILSLATFVIGGLALAVGVIIAFDDKVSAGGGAIALAIVVAAGLICLTWLSKR